MKSSTILTSYILLFFATLGFLFWVDPPTSSNDSATFAFGLHPTPAPLPPTPTPTPRPAQPVTFIIPKIGVNTAIESVGKDLQGKMDVPKSWYTVGWYNLGARPGEAGSAVIDGHYDTNTGSPGVFYNLSSLSIGDDIIVIDELGKSYTYRINNIQSYRFDEVPLDYVFTASDTYQLNLITCDGAWDRLNHNYLRRIVIYSNLQQQ